MFKDVVTMKYNVLVGSVVNYFTHKFCKGKSYCFILSLTIFIVSLHIFFLILNEVYNFFFENINDSLRICHSQS